MENMQIGDYLVTFDEEGARIEHPISHTCYRVRGKEASTAISFVRHSWKLCVAMMRDHAAVLEPFKVEPPE